jgi:hypothetical protein
MSMQPVIYGGDENWEVHNFFMALGVLLFQML